MIPNLRRLSLLALLASAGLAACEGHDVTVYVALDQEHSEAFIARFEKESGLAVKARYDVEQNKTVALTGAILEEASRPRADVFWNNELAQTVRLAQKGLLAAYQSPSAADIPARFKDDEHLWTGFATRARVLIVNTEKLGTDPANWPKSMWDLTDPKWKGRCAVARPLTGTTLTHFTALAVVLGEQRFTEWLDGLEKNEVQFLQSNGATMKMTADSSNDIDFAFTDTDDFHVALTKGQPVACVFPDQGDGEIGTMLIPNSIAIVKNGPNPENARRLVDFVLSKETEAALAAAKSAQIPVRADVTGPASEWIRHIGSFREMEWDPEAVGTALDPWTQRFAARYQSAN